MSTSVHELLVPYAEKVTVTDDTVSVDLSDGRTISVPLAWYPRLLHATPEERNNWRMIGRGHGIHWEDIDEDICVKSLVLGIGDMTKPKKIPAVRARKISAGRQHGVT